MIDAVTVVEWGEGLAEALSIDRLELSLTRSDDDVRTLELRPVGPRWRELLDLRLGGLASYELAATATTTYDLPRDVIRSGGYGDQLV